MPKIASGSSVVITDKGDHNYSRVATATLHPATPESRLFELKFLDGSAPEKLYEESQLSILRSDSCL